MMLRIQWYDGRVERIRIHDGATVAIGVGDESYETWIHGADDEVIRVLVHGAEMPFVTIEGSDA